MNIAVVFAGGVGRRMNSKVKPKQFLTIHGKEIIIHTLELFEYHPDIDFIVVSCITEWIPFLKELLNKYDIKKVKAVVPGGKNGQESIYNGLVAAEKITNKLENNIVLIHDGVRPLITDETISDNLKSVKMNGSAITSVTVKETVLVVEEDGSIDYIPKRENSRLARAPQSFWLEDIIGAHRKAISEQKFDFIDSCSMMQYYGAKLFLVEGPQENIKITTPEDFYTMRALLDAKENTQIYGYE